jgi:hypothetical protein
LGNCRETIDNKTKLQAFAQLNEGYKFKMDLTTNGVVITDAIKIDKAQLQDIKEHKEEGEEQQEQQQQEQRTHNGIF